MWWFGLWMACGTAGVDPGDRTDPTLPADAVRLRTTPGDVVLQLDRAAAPATVDNVLAYVDAGFYDGTDGLGATIWHRVVPGFVVQGGGFTAELRAKRTDPPVPYEGDNGRSNLRGTVAMARTSDPDSATSQWFVNLVDNAALDHAGETPGYTVFGEVVEGMDVVDDLAAVATSSQGGLDDVPDAPVVWEEVLRGP